MAGFNINTWTVSGNLTRDPETRSLPSGATVTVGGIAYNHRYKGPNDSEWQEQVNYFDFVIWGKLGESFSRKARKGQKWMLSGRAQWHSWEGDGGVKRSKVELVVDTMIGPEEYVNAGGGGRSDFGPPPGGGQFGPSDVPADTSGFEPPGGGDFQPPAEPKPEEDIPF